MLKKLYVLIIAAAAVLCLGIYAYAQIGFTNLYDNLDLRKNTKLHVTEYWKDIEGKEVTWSGTVVDVKGGRGKAEILVANRERALIKGYNIILIVPDISRAAKLKKGQKISFKGYLHDYKSGRHGSVVITLRDVEIL